MLNEEATTATPQTRVSLFDRHNLLLLAVAFGAFLIDHLSKRLVEANMDLYQTIPILGPYFGFTRTQNTGAAFSLLTGGNYFFIVVALIVTGFILYYAPRLPASDWQSRVGLGFQLGGALGNLFDRLRQGYVTDFLHVQIPEIGFDWPVSNIADIWIFTGVVILLILSYKRDRAAAR